MPNRAKRVAWVTGASSGIGRALALRLASDGWTVAASARRERELTALAAQAEAGPGEIVAVPLDVTQRDAVRDAVARIEADVGAVALAVLNAGSYRRDSAADFDAQAFGRHLDLNVMGAVHGLEALMPRMIERRGGRIAVVASVAGYRGLPGAAAYSASKAAVIALGEALRPELERHGVILQVVNPGFVRTPLTERNDFPMPFLMEVEDAVDAFVRGLRGNRFEITFPWRFSALMKLLRILPDRLFFAVTRRMVRS